MQRVTRKELRTNVARWAEHHNLPLTLQCATGSVIVFYGEGNALVRGATPKEADMKIRAWICGYLFNKQMGNT